MKIVVSYSTRTEESARDYAQIIMGDLIPVWDKRFVIDELKHQYADGREGDSYFNSEIHIWVVEADDIYTILGQLDAVKLGWVEIDNSIMQDMFGDINITVDNSCCSIDAANSLAGFLHDKIQTNDSVIDTLEARIAHQSEIIALQSKSIDELTEKYRSLMVWLHTGINLDEMKRVLIEVTEEVDSDILDNFQSHKIH